jgi:hypothetical protein
VTVPTLHDAVATVPGELAWNTPGETLRARYYAINETRCEEIAMRAIARGLHPNAFAVVLIDVDDPMWTPLADALMPNEDWQSFRDAGARPCARGSAMRAGLCDLLAEMARDSDDPDLARALEMDVPEGAAMCLVMAAGGLTVRWIEPRPEAS